MVEKTIQAERNNNYDVCVEITNENAEEVFAEQCSHPLVEDKLACNQKSGFCMSCCSQYVGLNFMSVRTECVEACQEAVDELADDEDSCADSEEEEDEVDQELEEQNNAELTGENVE
jgi:hypothetical protein